MSIGEFRKTLQHPYTTDVCFLCATQLTRENTSEEHVIPKWLQRKYDLWNYSVKLLNGTFLQYKNLKIPCCKTCNNENLSGVESQVQVAIENGIEAVRQLPKFLLAKWLAKIFLGIVYKELFLSSDRRNPGSETIANPELLCQLSILHFWLQVSRLEDDAPFQPGSIFLFSTHEYEEQGKNFDLLDNPIYRTIAVRIGKVGIIADFLENGNHAKNASEKYAPYENVGLEHIQFRELSSRIFYAASLLTMETNVRFVGSGEELGFFFECKPTGPNGQWWGEWKVEDFIRVFSFYTQIPPEELHFPPDKIRSWLDQGPPAPDFTQRDA